MKIKIYICLLFLMLAALPARAQLTKEARTANYILNMSKFVDWEQEATIDTFFIGVLGAEEVFNELESKRSYFNVKDRPYQTIQFKKVKEIGDIQILYVDKKKNFSAKKILDIAIDQSILMFTDSCKTPEYVMINLFDMMNPENRFELNQGNLSKARLTATDKLLLYGGTEEDLRTIYHASQKELNVVQESLAKQTRELEAQKAELELRRNEIQNLNDEISVQRENLNHLASDIDAKQDSLNQKIIQLETQKSRIKQQETNIELQRQRLLQQAGAIQAGSEFLDSQRQEMRQQEKEIENQQLRIAGQNQTLNTLSEEIQEQTTTIEKQQNILYLFVAFFVLIAGLIFFMLRAYRIKREANRKLEEKNEAISRQNREISEQKEEIQLQREQLQKTNLKIEKQNENIKSSILYALTIQKALLPLKQDIDQFFETYLIYRPRDIVSGDFYWMSENLAIANEGQKVMLAVVDCTGHGVPGAFLSMIGIKLLNAIVNERKEYQPKQVLELLNAGVFNALKQGEAASDDGMDVSLCLIEKKESGKFKLTYCGARRPLYFSRGSDQKIEIVPGDRKTIGGKFFQHQVFTQKELFLSSGDRIFLTTDGISDQNAPNRQKFGSKRLIKLLEDSLDLSLENQGRAVEAALDAFMQNEKQRDDISLLALRF